MRSHSRVRSDTSKRTKQLGLCPGFILQFSSRSHGETLHVLIRGQVCVRSRRSRHKTDFLACFCSVPYGDRREEHHGGHVVEKSREDGGDEAEDDDHGPDSSPGQLVRLQQEVTRH